MLRGTRKSATLSQKLGSPTTRPAKYGAYLERAVARAWRNHTAELRFVAEAHAAIGTGIFNFEIEMT